MQSFNLDQHRNYSIVFVSSDETKSCIVVTAMPRLVWQIIAQIDTSARVHALLFCYIFRCTTAFSSQSYKRVRSSETGKSLNQSIKWGIVLSMRNLLETLWDMRDPRVDDWPLMNSVLPTVAICAAYFYIVKFLGPWIMKNRQPYDLKNTIRVYNLAQVCLSWWILICTYMRKL